VQGKLGNEPGEVEDIYFSDESSFQTYANIYPGVEIGMSK